MSKVTEIVDDLRNIEGVTSNLQSQIDASNTSKQDVLVSGTNIKTVNSTSILGSGNVDVQPTLVSGTNIKTVNGDSLLGSGDMSIVGGFSNMAVVTASGTFTTTFTGKHRIYCVGGGGAGGQSNATTFATATGGGAGGIAIHEATFNSGTVITCVIGAGGVAPTTVNTDGGDGGTTTVSTTDASSTVVSLSATGGTGGTQSLSGSAAISGGLGGNGTGGNVFNGIGGTGGSVSGTTTSTCIRATGGGGVPLVTGAITRGGNIAGNSTTTDAHGATGGGGAYYRGGDISSLGTEGVVVVATGGAGTLENGVDSASTTGIISTLGGLGFSTNASKFGLGVPGITGSSLAIKFPSGNIGAGGGGIAKQTSNSSLNNIYSLPFGGSGGYTATTNAAQIGCKVGYGGGKGGVAVPVAAALTSITNGGDGVVIIEW